MLKLQNLKLIFGIQHNPKYLALYQQRHFSTEVRTPGKKLERDENRSEEKPGYERKRKNRDMDDGDGDYQGDEYGINIDSFKQTSKLIDINLDYESRVQDFVDKIQAYDDNTKGLFSFDGKFGDENIELPEENIDNHFLKSVKSSNFSIKIDFFEFRNIVS